MNKFRFRFLIAIFTIVIIVLILLGIIVSKFILGSDDSVNQDHNQFWFMVIGLLGLVFTVILLLLYKITIQYMKQIESATNAAIELAKGNYKIRIYNDRFEHTSNLSQSINILARNLQEMTKYQEMQQDRLLTLIENMGSSLVLIDSRGYINLINRAFKETFHIKELDYLYQLYYKVIPYEQINLLIETIFMTEKNGRKEVVLPLNNEQRHFDVYGAPILGVNNEWKGVVLVFHDITELKKLEQIRKDFVANVSHELKTPITSIKGFTETLIDGAMKNEETLTSFLDIILKESNRLQRLVQDLLDLSKIEQHGFTLDLQHVDITQILKEIMVILQKKADEKKINLSFSSAADHIFMYGDSNRLKQIFLNLINNAIAYTPTGGEIIVSIDTENEKVVFSVKDNGIGIEKAEIPRIFERFYRIDKDRSRHSGGTGLGLAIVKHLVEAHHGSISVDSEPGQGSIFTVVLKKNE